MIVTLIGYRGSGKSSVGRELAATLGCRFVDADVELERRAGKTIRQIFADDGETAFRDLETETLADLLQSTDTIVAAGGGAVLRAINRERMNSAGVVVWLQATAEHLYERINADVTTAERRPNLTAQGGLDEIRQLLSQREPLYRETADVEVNTAGLDVPAIVSHIEQSLRQRGTTT